MVIQQHGAYFTVCVFALEVLFALILQWVMNGRSNGIIHLQQLDD